MALTLNQVIKRVETLALSHLQINSFFYGDPTEHDANMEVLYPACFLQSLPGSIDRTNHVQRFNFRLSLFDRVGVSADAAGNETEVLSDMHLVASDIKSMLEYSGFQDDWVIGAVSPVTPATEQMNDLVAGAVMDVEIDVDYLSDRCRVPADDVTFETDFDMARTKIYTYDATGSEGNSWTIAGLSGKNVLACWRAGLYKRVLITAADSESIQLGGVDLGNYNGVVTNGVITMPSGDAPVLNEKFDFLLYD